MHHPLTQLFPKQLQSFSYANSSVGPSTSIQTTTPKTLRMQLDIQQLKSIRPGPARTESAEWIARALYQWATTDGLSLE